jgi:hypothetical protein
MVFLFEIPLVWYTRWKNRGYLAPQVIARQEVLDPKLKHAADSLIQSKEELFNNNNRRIIN